MNDKVYISIVNYNGYTQTINCLKSILKIDYDNFNIILIDNKSTDDSFNKLKLWFDTNNLSYGCDLNKNNFITLLKSKYNGGYAYANNISIRIASKKSDNPYIWILNNDTTVKKNTLTSLINSYNKNNKQILGSKILFSNTSNIDSYGGRVGKFFFSAYNNKNNNNLIDYIPGTSIFFKKEVIDEIGYLCEDYFMYYEDVDWSIKAFRNGIKLKIVNDSVVRHYKNKYVPLKLRFYSFKNRLLFIYKNYPLFFPIQIILIPIYIIKKIILK